MEPKGSTGERGKESRKISQGEQVGSLEYVLNGRYMELLLQPLEKRELIGIRG